MNSTPSNFNTKPSPMLHDDFQKLMVRLASYVTIEPYNYNELSFRYKIIHLLQYILGVPRADELKNRSIKSLNNFEELSSCYMALRYGFSQKHGSYQFNSSKSFNTRLFIIRLLTIVNLFRIFGILVSTDETIQIYLGNSYFQSKHSRAFNFIGYITLVALFIMGEIFLNLEARGHFRVFCDLNHLRNTNLNPSSVGLSHKNLNNLLFIVHIIATQCNRIMISAVFYIFIILNAPIIANRNTHPVFTVYGLFWTITLAYPFTYHMAGNFGRSAYILMIALFYFFRLRTINTLIVQESRQLLLVDRDVRALTKIITAYCNEAENMVQCFKYVVLYLIIVIAFMADVHIFFGVIVRLNPAVISNLLAINGGVIIGCLGLTIYFAGVYLNMLQSTVTQFHRVCAHRNISVMTNLKILELMYRMAGPYNGIRAGDFATLTTKFFVIFLVENASTMMLFAVNAVKTLIH